jgi:hypothetical protein
VWRTARGGAAEGRRGAGWSRAHGRAHELWGAALAAGGREERRRTHGPKRVADRGTVGGGGGVGSTGRWHSRRAEEFKQAVGQREGERKRALEEEGRAGYGSRCQTRTYGIVHIAYIS